MARIRIGLMYSNQVMVEARRLLFSTDADFDVVFDEGNANAGLELVPESTVDVLVVDTRLRGMSGVEFVARMHRRYLNPEAKLPKVILTAPFFSEELLLAAIRAGATDLVPESDGAAGLMAAIKSAMVQSQDINYRELKRFFEQGKVEAGSNPRWLLKLTDLEEREVSALALVEHGFNDSKAAEILGIPETSVRWAVENLMKRMGVATRAQMALALFEAGRLQADSRVPKELKN
ncbi:MAG: response regulator [Micrococcales bacterium]